MDESGDQLRRLTKEIELLSNEVRDLRGRVGRLEMREPPPPQAGPKVHFGLAALNRIGALTLAIGVIFFFKYAVDNRWIGAGGRIGLGLAGGLLLIAVGEWLRARNEGIFSQGIAGCGLATLYISCYAAFAWYHFLSQLGAAAALAAVSGLAVAVSLRYSHAAISALGFTGGLLTPILLGDRTGAAVTLPYLFLLDGACVLIVCMRRWALLAPVIGAETLVAALYLTYSTEPEWFPLFALVMAAVHLGAAALMRKDRPVYAMLFATGHGSIALGLLREVILWTRRAVPEPARGGAESEFGSLFLACYGIVALAWGIARNSPLARTLGLILTSVVILKLYLWDVWFLERLYRMSAFGVLGILLLTASWIYSRARGAN
ncbi:MAG TPA: DUF2339 domain-containing protein [Bryobacteraceae bacterium]|nr:DUF2339 domain-containing protein [Bryobacteraceae bacterium]